MLTVTIDNMKSGNLGIDGLKVDTDANAEAALTALDTALGTISTQRSKLGAAQNRMEYAIENLSTTSENLSAAESRIRDVDMAEEMVSYTKNSILNQSAMAMLAQANQQPQQILSLLA
jgi:flagellin